MQQFRSRTIKVNKEELLNILRKNKKLHVNDYSEAYEAFIVQYIKRLESMIVNVEDGEKPELNIRLYEPISYEEDYQQIIDMLEMSVDTEIEITAEEFQAYVKDKWSWKQDAIATYSSYTGKIY